MRVCYELDNFHSNICCIYALVTSSQRRFLMERSCWNRRMTLATLKITTNLQISHCRSTGVFHAATSKSGFCEWPMVLKTTQCMSMNHQRTQTFRRQFDFWHTLSGVTTHSITTLSMTTLVIMTLGITTPCHYAVFLCCVVFYLLSC